jgi:RHS repeat-associated protein
MRRTVFVLLATLSALSSLATEPVVLGPYQYDGAGNISAIGPNEQFLYDRDARLRKAVMTPGTQTFTYDAFGNRTDAQTTSGITHCNGGADCARVTGVQSPTNRLIGANYDAAGALTSLDGRLYTYDPLGMMTSQHYTQLVQYVYTADDERIAVYNGSRWEWSLRDAGAHVIRQVTSDDAPSAPASASWTWTADEVFRGGTLLASERPAAIGRRHFHLDHLGTPRLITTDTGSIAASYEYYAFGPQPDASPAEIPTEELKFTGHQRDLANGDLHVLDYMHARYYDGAVGRFLSVDPAIGKAGDPQSWNRYAYVDNNPLNHLDPTGRCGEGPNFVGPRLDCASVRSLPGPSDEPTRIPRREKREHPNSEQPAASPGGGGPGNVYAGVAGSFMPVVGGEAQVVVAANLDASSSRSGGWENVGVAVSYGGGVGVSAGVGLVGGWAKGPLAGMNGDSQNITAGYGSGGVTVTPGLPGIQGVSASYGPSSFKYGLAVTNDTTKVFTLKTMIVSAVRLIVENPEVSLIRSAPIP